MHQLLSELKQEFDFIIFDAPPALLVTDATILARIADTTLIVVAHQETKKDNLDKVQKSIKNVGGNLAGVVINKIPTTIKRYQDSYYGTYYGDTQDLVKTQKSNQDLYLRGKATILEDRQKNRGLVENKNKNDENIEEKNSNSTIGQTEEMLKKMNEYLEQQKRNMNNN
jgi:Mrp family chromosome partitioning ATPase